MKFNENSREFKILDSALYRLWDAYNDVDRYSQYDILRSIEAALKTIWNPDYADVLTLFEKAIACLYYLDANEREYAHGAYDLDNDDFIFESSYKASFTEASGAALANAEDALMNAEEALYA